MRRGECYHNLQYMNEPRQDIFLQLFTVLGRTSIFVLGSRSRIQDADNITCTQLKVIALSSLVHTCPGMDLTQVKRRQIYCSPVIPFDRNSHVHHGKHN